MTTSRRSFLTKLSTGLAALTLIPRNSLRSRFVQCPAIGTPQPVDIPNEGGGYQAMPEAGNGPQNRFTEDSFNQAMRAMWDETAPEYEL